MIRGIGIDIEMISRIADVMKRWDTAFLERIFTQRERDYCVTKGNPPQHFAARFAAKEAFSKAIGTGWTGQFHWTDVEVENDETGKPSLQLHGELEKYLSTSFLHLSLSHTADYVAAVVVVEHVNNQNARK